MGPDKHSRSSRSGAWTPEKTQVHSQVDFATKCQFFVINTSGPQVVGRNLQRNLKKLKASSIGNGRRFRLAISFESLNGNPYNIGSYGAWSFFSISVYEFP